jgi:Ras-related protein Rab-1A|eukprot:TRINITY_DN74447_c0_g1_i1.p1 TRINITY_DN74447_c0_g1~~TRINITY_DN74447_c0_g1_i1.p1  ORF type:complete len:576 (+),score=100.73 TRINITY_DN74447_c0_g1_i1:87-1814(+)
MDEEQEHEHPVRNLVLSVCDLKQHGDAPAPRCGSQTVTMATRMYLHGGCDEKHSYGDLHLLEIEQMKWTELQTEGQAPAARWGHTVEGHDSDLVMFGGLVTEEEALLSGGDKQAGPTTPPFAQGLAWGHGGKPSNTLCVMETQNLTWQTPTCVGTPPPPRFCHAACVTSDSYVVFGGCGAGDFSKPLNDIHWLDLKSMQWTSPQVAGQAPPPRYAHKLMVGTDETIFVFGGVTAPGTSDSNFGTLYSFKLSTATWSIVQVAGTPPLDRSFHSFDLIGKWGFVFAGSTTTGISDLYILDLQNTRWARPLYEGQVNVRAHASSVLHDKLIVFGGVRDKAPSRAGQAVEPRISKKLFFLNVLVVKSGVAEGDFKFKLVTVGDSGVGKSCLLTRFVNDFYSDFHVSTIGVDFKTVITMVKGRLVKLQLWDTAGQERFSVVTGNYYRNSDGFVFVYDATNRASFDHVEQWLSQVQQHHECGPTTIKILIGNKSDMTGELVVSEEEGRAKAESMGAFFIAASAKTASNVDMAFLTAAQSLVETRRKQKVPKSTPASGGQARLGQQAPASSGKGKCACAGAA